MLHFLKLCRGCRGKLQLGIFVTACSVRGFGFEDCKSLSDEQGFRENLFCHSLAASGDRAEQQLAKRCTGEEMSSRKKKTQGTLIGSKYMRIFFLSFHLKTAYQKSLQKLTVWIG